MTDDQDWRLRLAFDDAKAAGAVFDRLRGHEKVLGSEVGGVLPFGAVLSHDDDTLFVYASTRSGVDSARRAINGVLHTVGDRADLRISHWDEDVGEWCQVEPPLSGEEQELADAHAREARRHETRTLSCIVGRLDRTLVEGPILDFAQRRGLDCAVEREGHVFSLHLTFSVSGPAFKVSEFIDFAGRVVSSQRGNVGGAGPL